MGVLERQDSALELEEKLLRFMDQLELLEQKRGALNSLIEQGWFLLTQARYSMGNKHVSSLQYASEMEPLVCVEVRTLEDGEVKFSTEKCPQKYKGAATSHATPVEDIGPQEEGIRRRNKPQKIKTGADTRSENVPVEKSRKKDQNPQQDPLKWFGILVPQPLKQAQTSFKKVIELSTEIAALQIAVLNTRKELKHRCGQQLPEKEFSISVGKVGEKKDSSSEQEETKPTSATESH